MAIQTLYQVDAFTSVPFRGNPAAVCILSEYPDDAWLQNVAREMNLSETAFVIPGKRENQLRWFTPTDEVELCGHATLATTHVLLELGLLREGEKAEFRTRSGMLRASGADGWIYMDFPAEPAIEVAAPEVLAKALSTAMSFVGRNRMDYLVELPNEEAVRSLDPELSLIAALDARGVCVTAASDSEEYDFVSRFFAPQLGVPEDPVTGSAHCCLGPYWEAKLGSSELTGYQASARGGEVRVSCKGDRVELIGQAVTVMKLQLVV